MSTVEFMVRNRVLKRIHEALTKTTPDNSKLVGPAFYGKTSILRALEENMKRDESPYEFTSYWNLARRPPQSDDEFVAAFCRQLKAQFTGEYTDYGDYLAGGKYPELMEVVETLSSENLPILAIWDGVDKPLREGKLTGGLWDSMRPLFTNKKRHRVCISARDEPINLTTDEDVGNSTFWNLFQSTINIGPYDDDDLKALCEQQESQEFKAGAITELRNWTSGIPVLVHATLEFVKSDGGRVIDNHCVVDCAKKVVDSGRLWPKQIWSTCEKNTKDAYVFLTEHGDQGSKNFGKHTESDLLLRGLASSDGKKLTASCRILRTFSDRIGEQSGSLSRLFGTPEAYKDNIQDLLSLRLSNISELPLERGFVRMQGNIKKMITDLPDAPEDCLGSLQHFMEAAFDLIWTNECEEGTVISDTLVDYWRDVRWVSTNRHLTKLIENNRDVSRLERNEQMTILQFLTGSNNDVETKGKFANKDSYVLLSALHNYRNRDIHPDGDPVGLGIAVSGVNLCIDLCECLVFQKNKDI
jgi:hypothetical protein